MSSVSLPLFRALGVESRKYRRTMALWLAILAPALIVLLNFCIFYFRGEHIVDVAAGDFAWRKYGMMNIQPSINLLFPLYIVLLAVWFFQIEHQSQTWKHLWVLPVRRSTQFLAKVLLFLGFVAGSLLIFLLLIYASGWVLMQVRPELGFDNTVGVLMIAKAVLYMLCASVGIIALQFWFSMRWKSLMAPLSIGMAGIISALLLSSWEHIAWHPYSTLVMSIVRMANADAPMDVNPLVYSGVLAIGVFFLAFWEGSRRALRG